jgi:hypothetical protein
VNLPADTDPETLMQTTAPLAPRAVEIIEQAAALVGGHRHKQHGEKRENMQNISDLWNSYLGSQMKSPITAAQVAWLNVLQKVARTKSGSRNIDNAVDAAGYAGIAGELME